MMKTSNKGKALLIVACAILLVMTTVFATLAFFTDEKTVTNTFTIGNIAITLDEGTVKDDGTFDADTRSADGLQYVLVPGSTYDKDPLVTVTEGSLSAYLFVKVENGIASVEDDANTIESQILENWTKLEGVDNVYYTLFDADAETPVYEYPVFTTFTIDADCDYATLNALENKSITITAYAIQSENVTDAAAAWAALQD